MAKRIEPMTKKPKEVLDDLRRGTLEAAAGGPKSALRFLERTILAQHSLPNGVKFFAWDLLAEYAWQAGEPERCEEAVREALSRWGDAEEQFRLDLRDAIPSLTFIERGIAVRCDAGDFAGALALCDFAIEHRFGAHYEAKRDNLGWARG
jgi:hypothetical protein